MPTFFAFCENKCPQLSLKNVVYAMFSNNIYECVIYNVYLSVICKYDSRDPRAFVKYYKSSYIIPLKLFYCTISNVRLSFPTYFIDTDATLACKNMVRPGSPRSLRNRKNIHVLSNQYHRRFVILLYIVLTFNFAAIVGGYDRVVRNLYKLR